ncbi:MAG: flagellar hook-length control protein FliK [Calditrichaeota bacterium]|nr:flagellar hook-length control protein FliK [Calditrichota bacterium]
MRPRHEQVKPGHAPEASRPETLHVAPARESQVQTNLVRNTRRTASAARTPHAERVFEQLRSGLVKHRLGPNQNSLVVQLRPPELGRIRIRVEAHGQVLRAVVEADSSATRDLLHSSVQHLVQTLDEQGLRVQQIQILPFANRQATPEHGHDSAGRQAAPDWTEHEAGEDSRQREQPEDRWRPRDGGWLA